MDAQHKRNNLFPPPRVELAYPHILAIYPITNHRVVRCDKREKLSQIANSKLSIRVHKKGQFLRRSSKTTDQSSTISLVDGVRDQTNMPVFFAHGSNNGCCLVHTAVVDHNHLEILHPCRECTQDI